MPITLNGDGTVGGVTDFTDVDGGDFVATSVETTGNLLIHEVSANRYTLRVDETNNTVGINTSGAPAAGTFLQIADATDPIVSLSNTVGPAEVRLGCTAANGYIGTNSSTDFRFITNNITRASIASNGHLYVGHPGTINSINETRFDYAGGTNLAITAASGGCSLLMGNRDSDGANFPSIIRSGNGNLEIGNGNNWSNNLGGSFTRHLHIEGLTGNILFAPTGTPNAHLEVRGTGTQEIRVVSTNGNSRIGLDAAGSGYNYIEADGASQSLIFARGNAEVARFNSTGNLAFPNGQGIDFSAVQGANAASSILDDYEEGTFTPSYGNLRNFTHSSQVGRYVKVGKLVTVYIQLATVNAASVSDNGNSIIINGLPFGAENINNSGTSMLVLTHDDRFTNNPNYGQIQSLSSTSIVLFKDKSMDTGSKLMSTDFNATDSSNFNLLNVNFTYEVDS